MTSLLSYLDFIFVQRALWVGGFIAAGCGLLGVFLVLRRVSMVGDGLSHVAFGAIGLALMLGWAPLALTLPLVAIASLGIFILPERAAMYGDAAIGMVSVVGVATGVLLASLGGGFNVDVFSFLFGDILAVSRTEARLAVGLALSVAAIIALAYHDLFALTFDPVCARVSGIRLVRMNRLLAVLTALMVVLGIRVVGTMLVSSLLIFPAATALQVCRSFRSVLFLSAGLGMVSVLVGICCALVFNAPAGAVIVLLHALCFCIALGFRGHRARG